jgi:phosphate transport system permease protein
MVVAIAGGGLGGSLFNLDVTEGGQTMTAAMAAVSPGSGSDQAAGSDLAFPSLFFVGSLLFLITLGLNVIADRFVRRVRQHY